MVAAGTMATINPGDEPEVWDAAWMLLKNWLRAFQRRRAWERVVAEAVLHSGTVEPTEAAFGAMLVLVNRPEPDLRMEHPDSGEYWQYMGTFSTARTGSSGSAGTTSSVTGTCRARGRTCWWTSRPRSCPPKR